MNTPALCDCCNERPGTALIDTGALAGETWCCDQCRGIDPADYDDGIDELSGSSWQEELEEQTYQMTHSFGEPR
jgi:hypothetical protein